MEMPHPPCCAIGVCKKCFNDCGCCQRLGEFGLKSFDSKRGCLMMTAALMSTACLVFCLIALASISHDSDVVENVNWTVGESNHINFYVGLSRLVIDSDITQIGNFTVPTYIEWDSESCDSGYCNDCENAANNVISSLIVAFITCFPTLMTDFQRSTRKGDLNCQKFMAILTGIIGTITNLTALSAYASECYTNLPDEYAGQSMSYHLGPAFNLMLIATILKPFDVLIHLFTPVVPPADEENKGFAGTGTGGMQQSLVGNEI